MQENKDICKHLSVKRNGHQKISDSFKQIGQTVIHLDDETHFDEAKREMSSGKEIGRGNKNDTEETGDEDQL